MRGQDGVLTGKEDAHKKNVSNQLLIRILNQLLNQGIVSQLNQVRLICA